MSSAQLYPGPLGCFHSSRLALLWQSPKHRHDATEQDLFCLGLLHSAGDKVMTTLTVAESMCLSYLSAGKQHTSRAPHGYEAVESISRDVGHSRPSQISFAILLLHGLVGHMLWI